MFMIVNVVLVLGMPNKRHVTDSCGRCTVVARLIPALPSSMVLNRFSISVCFVRDPRGAGCDRTSSQTLATASVWHTEEKSLSSSNDVGSY